MIGLMKGVVYISANLIRKTPSKILAIFLIWFAYSVFYYKFRIIKTYYDFKIKGERESKRKIIFKLSCLI
jgi:hypothetical protein